MLNFLLEGTVEGTLGGGPFLVSSLLRRDGAEELSSFTSVVGGRFRGELEELRAEALRRKMGVGDDLASLRVELAAARTATRELQEKVMLPITLARMISGSEGFRLACHVIKGHFSARLCVLCIFWGAEMWTQLHRRGFALHPLL